MACSYTALRQLQVMASAGWELCSDASLELSTAAHGAVCGLEEAGYERRAESVLTLGRGACQACLRAGTAGWLLQIIHVKEIVLYRRSVSGDGGPGVVSRAGTDPASRTRWLRLCCAAHHPSEATLKN